MRTVAGVAASGVHGGETQKPIAGSYTGSLTVGGETYTAATTMDLSSVLAAPTQPGVTLTRTTLGVSGTVPTGSTLAGVVYTTISYVAFGSDHDNAALPAIDTLKTPLAAGTYSTGVYGFSSPVSSFVSATPAKFNQSYSRVASLHNAQKSRPRRAFLVSVTKSIEAIPDALELYRAIDSELKPKHRRVCAGLLDLFLSTERRTLLRGVETVSTSTVSRCLNTMTELPQLNRRLWDWQAKCLRKYGGKHKGQTPWLVIRVDMTSIEKTGKKLPYLRTVNAVNGIHLVALHVSMGKLSFPMGHEIYDPAHPDVTPIMLAARLIKRLHPFLWGDFKQFVVMNSGFYSGEFLDLLRWWGFEHISVSGRSNLKVKDGRFLRDTKKGEQVELDSAPGRPLYVSWVDLPRDGKTKRFFVLDTVPGTARTLTRRHKRGWLIESFFKSAKHDFGLKETRLRTETGIKNWLFLVMLSASLALWRQCLAEQNEWASPRWNLTLQDAAAQIRDALVPHQVACRLRAALARLPESTHGPSSTHKTLLAV